MHENAERREEVQPAHVDKDGRPYIVLSRPNGQTSDFHLDESDCHFVGDVKTFTPEEPDYWQRTLVRK